MATSSRQSAIFGANDWKTIYQTFRQADFQSYDYETLRKSFVDYLRLYYPETFNYTIRKRLTTTLNQVNTLQCWTLWHSWVKHLRSAMT